MEFVFKPKFEFTIREIQGHGFIIEMKASGFTCYLNRDMTISCTRRSVFENGVFDSSFRITKEHIQRASDFVTQCEAQYMLENRIDKKFKDFRRKV